jgi:hypothetical protein
VSDARDLHYELSHMEMNLITYVRIYRNMMCSEATADTTQTWLFLCWLVKSASAVHIHYVWYGTLPYLTWAYGPPAPTYTYVLSRTTTHSGGVNQNTLYFQLTQPHHPLCNTQCNNNVFFNVWVP